MHIAEQHIISKQSKEYKNLDHLCFLSKNLYNSALWTIKKEFELSGKILRYIDLYKKFKNENQQDYLILRSTLSQQILMLVDKNIKSYFKLLKKWKTNKKSLKACPQFPKYKHKIQGRNPIILSTALFRFKKDNLIHFANILNIKPLKTKISKDYKLCQCRIVPRLDHYIIEIIYEINDIQKLENSNNYLSIDLGLNNLGTCFNSENGNSFILNGKPLKSMNQFYNKKFAYYKSQLEKNHSKKSSNKTRKLTNKRNRKIKDYLHKASKYVINYALKNNITNIVIGKNKEWKQEITLGKKTNQNFVQIPFNLFESFLSYKCEKNGLTFKSREESYTSKCSCLDRESIQKHEQYLGKRIKRGMFRSSKNILINSDVNGSINILRKEVGDEFLNKFLLNRGLVISPVKLNF